MAHGAQNLVDQDASAGPSYPLHAVHEPVGDRFNGLGHGQPAAQVQFGGPAHLAVDNAVGGQGQYVLAGDPAQVICGLHDGYGVLKGF